jgi:hypothetical protein
MWPRMRFEKSAEPCLEPRAWRLPNKKAPDLPGAFLLERFFCQQS